MKAKTIGILVVILVLAVGSILAYNWKAITPPAVQTTTTAGTGPTMMRIKIPVNGCYVGAHVIGSSVIDEDIQKITYYENAVGRRMAIEIIPWIWPESSIKGLLPYFPRDQADRLVRIGIVPMIGWWATSVDSATGRAYPAKPQDVIEGRCDDLLTKWALQAKAFTYPVFLRLGWEMNLGLDSAKFPFQGAFNFGPYGNRSWSEVDDLYKYYGDPLKPDGPERFVDSWRHIHQIFDSLEVKNAVWVWCPNHNSVPDTEWNKPENYYPGDHYVDWVGCDLYNIGYYEGKTYWLDFRDLFKKNSGLEIYTKHKNKPFVLAEMGCSSESLPNVLGPKAKWILNAYDSIKNLYSNIKAVVWFSKDMRDAGEKDWRVDSSPESLEAYRKAISDPYFLDRIIFESTSSAAPSAFRSFTVITAVVDRTTLERRVRE